MFQLSLLALFALVARIEAVDVTVYYESLCPDSEHFFLHQLAPTFNKIGSFMNVELVPYGNAQWTGSQDQYQFSCQHGEEECFGNMAQACFIELVNDTKTEIDFINCAFSYSRKQRKTIEKCISNLDLRNQVKKCVSGPMGRNLLHQMGVKTDSLNPRKTFIPWTTINGKGNSEINDETMDDLMKVVCEAIEGQKPQSCLEKNKEAFRRFRQNYL